MEAISLSPSEMFWREEGIKASANVQSGIRRAAVFKAELGNCFVISRSAVRTRASVPDWPPLSSSCEHRKVRDAFRASRADPLRPRRAKI